MLSAVGEPPSLTLSTKSDNHDGDTTALMVLVTLPQNDCKYIGFQNTLQNIFISFQVY